MPCIGIPVCINLNIGCIRRQNFSLWFGRYLSLGRPRKRFIANVGVQVYRLCRNVPSATPCPIRKTSKLPANLQNAEGAIALDTSSRPVSPFDKADVSPSDNGQRPETFNPFFTLIENTTTGEFHHPHVYYLFSDDADNPDHSHGPENLTHTLLRCLEPRHAAKHKSSSGYAREDGDADTSYVAESTPNVSASERFVILDLAKDGQGVESAKSLSPEWQVSGTGITEAPTFAERPQTADSGTQEQAAMMLKIRGAGRVTIAKVTDDMQNTLDAAREQTGNFDGLLQALESMRSKYEQQIDELSKWKDNPSKM